jgi:hypothetical protein
VSKKPLNLKDARRLGKLDQFAKDHPSKGDRRKFDRLLDAMASGKKPKARRTSDEGTSED